LQFPIVEQPCPSDEGRRVRIVVRVRRERRRDIDILEEEEDGRGRDEVMGGGFVFMRRGRDSCGVGICLVCYY
jgi:hypothetical protein